MHHVGVGLFWAQAVASSFLVFLLASSCAHNELSALGADANARANVVFAFIISLISIAGGIGLLEGHAEGEGDVLGRS
jgi:hypothetical protein